MRNDFKEIVSKCQNIGKWAEYKDNVGTGGAGWSANVVLKDNEVEDVTFD